MKCRLVLGSGSGLFVLCGGGSMGIWCRVGIRGCMGSVMLLMHSFVQFLGAFPGVLATGAADEDEGSEEESGGFHGGIGDSEVLGDQTWPKMVLPVLRRSSQACFIRSQRPCSPFFR